MADLAPECLAHAFELAGDPRRIDDDEFLRRIVDPTRKPVRDPRAARGLVEVGADPLQRLPLSSRPLG
jgi:hypothetical protein